MTFALRLLVSLTKLQLPFPASAALKTKFLSTPYPNPNVCTLTMSEWSLMS